MNSRQRAYYTLGFILTVVLVSIFLAVAYQNLRRSEAESAKVKSVLESLHVLENIMHNMQAIESNQRGFIITGDSSFLNEFEDLLEKSKKDIATLAQIAKTDSSYSRSAVHLSAFVNKKISFSKKTITLKSEHKTEEAELLLQSGTGRQYLDSIRKYAMQLTNLDREFLQQANVGEARVASNMNLLFASLSAAFILIVALLFLMIRRDIRKQRKYESEIAHLATLVEQTSDAIISLDLHGTILSWNQGAAKMLGYSRQVAVGKYISEMTGMGLNVLQVKLISEEFKARGQMNAETLNYNKDGQAVYCLTSATTIRNRQGAEKGYVVVLNDITSKKETEKLLFEFNQELARQVDEKTQQIRQSEERYYSLVDQASDAIFVNDLSGQIIEVNSKACQLLGLTRDEICTKKIPELFTKDELDTKPIMQKELLAGQTTFVERNILHRDGYTIPVEITAKMTSGNRIMAIVRDIRERKQTEARLKASEKDLKNVLSGMADIFYVIDRNYRITIINDMAEQLLAKAWGKPVMQGSCLMDLIPANTDEPIVESFEKVFQGEKVEYELKNNIPGLPRWVSVSFRPVKGDCGAITGACVITRDITERKNAEIQLRTTTDQLRRLSAHLQDVREDERIFIAREIHDELGQQLTVLKLDVSRLQKTIDPAQAELKKQSENLMQLVNDTIKSVRRISSQLRPGMLDDLGLAAAIEWHAQEFEKRTGIKTIITTMQHEIDLPKQAANNLFRIYQEALTNVARHSHASEVNVLLNVENSELLLSIADNGIGFDTSEAENNTTLGILGIRERTSALGGGCTINSAPGKGTALEFVIPVKNNQ